MSNESLEPITERDFQNWKMRRFLDRASARLDILYGKPEIGQEVKERFGYKEDSNVIYLSN